MERLEKGQNLSLVQDYIISRLKSISIENLCIRYAYDKDRDVHVIEVSPDSIRFKDETFINFEFDFWDEFFEKYPEANMYFSEVDDYNNMENILYKLE